MALCYNVQYQKKIGRKLLFNVIQQKCTIKDGCMIRQPDHRVLMCMALLEFLLVDILIAIYFFLLF